MSQSTVNLLSILAFVVMFVVCAVFLRIVRTRQPDVWRALGSPTMFGNQDFHTSIRGMRYFLCRGYRNVTDRRFVMFCDFFLVIQVLVLLSFAYFVISTVIFYTQIALHH